MDLNEHLAKFRGVEPPAEFKEQILAACTTRERRRTVFGAAMLMACFALLIGVNIRIDFGRDAAIKQLRGSMPVSSHLFSTPVFAVNRSASEWESRRFVRVQSLDVRDQAADEVWIVMRQRLQEDEL